MTKRKAIPNKLRFEIFKRDNFTCVYCGAKSPEEKIVIDHINPVKNGGTNDIINLVTACQKCNSGKSAEKLTEEKAMSVKNKEIKKKEIKNKTLLDNIKWAEKVLKEEKKEHAKVISLMNTLSNSKLTESGEIKIIEAYKKYGIDLCKKYINDFLEDSNRRYQNKSKMYSFKEFISFKLNRNTLAGKKKYLMGMGMNIFRRQYCFNVFQEKLIHINDTDVLDIIEDVLKSLPYKKRLSDEDADELLQHYY